MAQQGQVLEAAKWFWRRLQHRPSMDIVHPWATCDLLALGAGPERAMGWPPRFPKTGPTGTVILALVEISALPFPI